MLIPTVIVGGALYYLTLTVMAERIALPDMIARDLLPVIGRVNVFLAIGLPVVFLVLLTWAAKLSYSFLAPLERLEEDLRRIDNGDYSVRIQINRDHDLAPVAEVINDLVDKLEREKGKI